MGCWTLVEVRDRSGDPRGGPGLGWASLEEVRDGLGDTRRSPGRVWGPSERYEMDR